jgi:laccase
MESRKNLKLELLGIFLLNVFVFSVQQSTIPTINWVLNETSYTRLCSTKKILTVNGLFPGPALRVHKGDRVRVNIANQGKYNVTLHWHGVKQPRNPWSDGPEYITQCPIKPGANFTYDLIFSSEEGTIWWHAHSDWSRATVHGPIIIYPKNGTKYPFSTPDDEFPLVLASWFKGDVMENIETALASGGEPNKSDALTINGQPGVLYNCSKEGTYKITFEHGKTYLLRLINAIMNEEVFFKIAQHNFTVVALDGAYIKPLVTDFIFITPGQAMDILITANQTPSHYYMAARAYAGVVYDNTTTTAIVQYNGNYTAPSTPAFPTLPGYNDTDRVTDFTLKLKALDSKDHPADVPKTVDTQMFVTISVNTLPCDTNGTCVGPEGNKLAASLNNVSFVTPEVDVLQAYYRNLSGIFETNFPNMPSTVFNYTADGNDLSDDLLLPETGTKAKVVKYNTTVEIIFQGTNLLSAAENHPMHLHGYSFYLIAKGYGNFNNTTDPKLYNLVDPPEVNTVGVPKNGWAVIRFRADNPGVWFMHCHLERHSSWGMDTVLIVKNGKTKATSMLPPPNYLNPC